MTRGWLAETACLAWAVAVMAVGLTTRPGQALIWATGVAVALTLAREVTGAAIRGHRSGRARLARAR